MPNKPGPSIYTPTDKSIYDAFQLKKVRRADALKFLRQRGIIVSGSMEKSDLSKTISSLTFSYQDFKHLTKLLENPNRKVNTTGANINASTDNNQLLKICQKIAKSSNNGDSYKISKTENAIIMVVTYTDVDFTRTELTQRSLKTCEIELRALSDSVSVRRPATNKGEEIAGKFTSALAVTTGEELKEETISLENIIAPQARSLFFDTLVKSIENHTLKDVSSVVVHHGADSMNNSDDEESTAAYASYINKASLAGGGVLQSAEFNQLHDRGFFISKIIWTVVDNLPGGDKLELEAQFGTPASCTNFKYLVRYVYNYNTAASAHNVTTRPPSRTETSAYNTLLENAAKAAFDHVTSKYMELDDEID